MGDAARILDTEKESRGDMSEEMQSKADVDEINRRITAFEAGNTRMFSRKEAKTILEDMGYHG